MLENQSLRNDIKIGEAALTLSVKSFGEGAASTTEIVSRAGVFYNWLLDERKR